tara:strand:+ start:2923 stop:3918 length:996 start_codon:yes stop_codon:yes gene_type:complete
MSILTPGLIALFEASTGNSIEYSIKKYADNANRQSPASVNTINSLIKGESKPHKRTIQKMFEFSSSVQPEFNETLREIIANEQWNIVEREILSLLVKHIFSGGEGLPDTSFLLDRFDRLIRFDELLIKSECHQETIMNSEFADHIPIDSPSKFMLKVWAGTYMMSAFDTLYTSIYEPTLRESICKYYGTIGRILRPRSMKITHSKALNSAAWQATTEDMHHYSKHNTLEGALALDRNNSEPPKVARRLLRGNHYLAAQTFTQTVKNLFEIDIHRDTSEIMHLIANAFARGTTDFTSGEHNDCRVIFAIYPRLLSQSKRDHQEWQSRALQRS